MRMEAGMLEDKKRIAEAQYKQFKGRYFIFFCLTFVNFFEISKFFRISFFEMI